MLNRTLIFRPLLIFGLVVLLASCRSMTPMPETTDVSVKKLERMTLPPDAVAFDVLVVHVPYQYQSLVRDLWREVDEQELDWESRHRLNEQGFRAGIVGATLPEPLSELMSLKGKALRTSIMEEVDLNKDDSIPLTFSKPVKLQAGHKSIIEIRDDVIPCIPILNRQNGMLVGRNYEDARTQFSVYIEPLADGSVKFQVTPVIKYGTPQSVTRYQYGQLVSAQEQPTCTFDDLKCNLAIRPGQFLIMGGIDNKINNLGHYFFTRGDDDLEQKILVIRLIATQHDGQFSQFPGFEELIRKTQNGENLEMLPHQKTSNRKTDSPDSISLESLNHGNANSEN